MERISLPLVLLASLTLAGCFGSGGGEAKVSGSGDPEADRRAEQRIGVEEPATAPDGKTPATLYQRLNGDVGIAAIVDDMTARVVADPRVNFDRSGVRTGLFHTKANTWDPTPANIERFKRHMTEFLTLAAGGPAQYTGRDMREVHKGMAISNSEFDAMVGDIKASMDRLGVPTRDKRDLLAVIETTRKQIVEKQ